jgi:uncharacterized protein YigA (DUF484 family)
VGVEAFIPNHDIVVNHDQHDKHSHEDIYIAIRDTFDAVERQIKELAEKQRRQSRHNGKLMENAALNDGLNNDVHNDVQNDTNNDAHNDIQDTFLDDIVSVEDYNSTQAANQ